MSQSGNQFELEEWIPSIGLDTRESFSHSARTNLMACTIQPTSFMKGVQSKGERDKMTSVFNKPHDRD